MKQDKGSKHAIKEATNHRGRPIALVDAAEYPFEIPPSWSWVSLEDTVRSISDGDHQAPPQVTNGIPFLTIGNISSGIIDFTETRFVAKEYYEQLDSRRVPARGDILYTVVGASYGRPVLIDVDQKFCIQRHIAILRPDGTCDTGYLFMFLNSPVAYSQATQSITGTAQPTVPLKPLRKFKVPLPPLAEQKRIVAKVDQLMALCDELETKLRQTEETSRKVAEALVADTYYCLEDVSDYESATFRPTYLKPEVRKC
jgi:type I restriction enzyme S subunit